jgi:hypothetical protein
LLPSIHPCIGRRQPRPVAVDNPTERRSVGDNLTSNPQGGLAAGASVSSPPRIRSRDQWNKPVDNGQRGEFRGTPPKIQEFPVVDKMHEGDGSGMILLEIGFRGVRLNWS